MSWVRYDDGFHDHPKVIDALDRDPGSVSLHLLANTWSSKTKRPGFVPHSAPNRLVGTKGKRWAAILVEAGLWHEVEGGWEFHDWQDYAAPAKYRTVAGTPEELSRKRAAAGRRGGQASGNTRRATKQPAKQTGRANEANEASNEAEAEANRASPVVGSSTALTGLELPTPEPVPPSAGVASPRPLNAGDVVAAWIDAITAFADGEKPPNDIKGKLARQARELVEQGKDPAVLVEAATSAGGKGYADLSQELLALARENHNGRRGQQPRPGSAQHRTPANPEASYGGSRRRRAS